MSTTIGGHRMTRGDLSALNALRDHLLKHARDSHASETTSPKGDGRSISLFEIFPSSADPRMSQANALARSTLRRLRNNGVLKACEIQLEGGMCKLVPFSEIKD